MAIDPELLKQYIATYNSGPPPIDIPSFEQNYLQAAPSPPQVTAIDPQTNVLATVGAGLAQPVQYGQSDLGNIANAALAGLQQMQANRAANAQAEQLNYANALEATGLRNNQGQTFINANNANTQAAYYAGLLRNAGMGNLLDANAGGTDRVLEWAKLSKDLTDTILTNGVNIYDEETLQAMYPTGGLGIFQDAMNMFLQNQSPEAILRSLQQQQAAAAEQAKITLAENRYAQLQQRYPTVLLNVSREDFEKNTDAYLKQMRAYDTNQSAREDTGVGSLAMSLFNPVQGTLPYAETPEDLAKQHQDITPEQLAAVAAWQKAMPGLSANNAYERILRGEKPPSNPKPPSVKTFTASDALKEQETQSQFPGIFTNTNPNAL